ncbi:MAG: M56 family metallopeptidase [Planctomycetes bacterium]|nr:M56 family metallopeptidase [Planctomycetota bacterium]
MPELTIDVERARFVVAWALTYLVHATLLLGAAWFVTRHAKRLTHGTREWIWRGALLGSLLTATTASYLGTLEFAPAWVLPGRVNAASDPGGPVGFEHAAEPALDEPAEGTIDALLAASEDMGPTPIDEESRSVPGSHGLFAVLAIWLLGACVVLHRLDGSRKRLRRILRARTKVEDGVLVNELASILRAVGSRRVVRLSTSQDLATPISFGCFRPEICVPERVLTELGSNERRTLLAHEFAHVRRFDTVWLAVHRVLATAFFFQPLLRVAQRKLHESSEILCDAWAVRVTGEPLGLARCLAKVAEWLLEGRSAPCRHAVPAMAQSGSALGERIRALLDGSSARPSRAGASVFLVIPVLVATAVAAPYVQGHASRQVTTFAIDATTMEADVDATRLAADIDAFEERWARWATALSTLRDVPLDELSREDPELAQAILSLRRQMDELAPLRERLRSWRARQP